MKGTRDNTLDYVVSLLEGINNLLKSHGEAKRLRLLKYCVEMAVIEAREQAYRKDGRALSRKSKLEEKDD